MLVGAPRPVVGPRGRASRTTASAFPSASSQAPSQSIWAVSSRKRSGRLPRFSPLLAQVTDQTRFALALPGQPPDPFHRGRQEELRAGLDRAGECLQRDRDGGSAGRALVLRSKQKAIHGSRSGSRVGHRTSTANALPRSSTSASLARRH